jgi:hypothetical protein
MSSRAEAPTQKMPGGDSTDASPLGPYALLTGLFAVAFGGGYVALHRRKRVPKRIDAADLLLVGVGTYKLSRLLSKDRVTSFLRAPFTESVRAGGPGVVEERPRGRGLRLAIGELLVCPYCLGQWVAAAFVLALAAAPRLTRLVAATLSVVTISDVLQIAYKAMAKKVRTAVTRESATAKPG